MRLNIKPLVDAKGINRNQLAKELKIGYKATCNLYEGNTERVYFDTLEQLCLVLECTPNDIIVSDNDQINRLLAYHNTIKNNEVNKDGTK